MQGDYTSLLLHYSNSSLISLFFLGLCRIFPIIAIAPFLGAKIAPPPVKVALGLSLFCIMLPHMMAVTTTPIPFDVHLVLLCLKEAFIGLVIGMLVSMPFFIANSAGIIIDFQRGASSMMANDPTLANQSSPIGLLYNYLVIVIFFAMDGQFILFDAILKSYTVIPPDKFLSANFFFYPNALWNTFIGMMSYVLALSLQLAAPALLVVLMTDTFLGIANRLAPQVQVTFLGMPLKSLAATVILLPGWALLLRQIDGQIHKWMDALNALISILGIK